ncbi:hypothetical protein [Henriciella aquimarina]|uniref:hypothetical protein n=1 Tax=Henriciella aquimarina TaxID=545261 RepID=UPI000A04B8CA|nr:hypothetical protein [Henriciella aquimarina]
MRTFILSALLFGTPGLATAQFHAEVNKAFDRSKSAITETVLMGREDKSLCEHDGAKVRYSGRTDLGLYTCLYKAAQAGANHLTITSFGGPVVNAVPAADIIAKHGMSVSVLGICASSCGNYIAPAASELNVLPYSLWSVHGAPGPVDEEALRDAMAASGANDEQIERSLSSNLRQGHYEFELHEAFKARHGIRDGLYDAQHLKAAEEALGETPQLYLSRATAAACAPDLKIGDYWEVSGQYDEEYLQRLFPSKTIGEYGVLADHRICHGTDKEG